MQNNELIAAYIDRYVDLQRILNADDPKAEAEHQLTAVKVTLESMGVVTTPLEQKK